VPRAVFFDLRPRARRDRRCARVAAWRVLPPGNSREPKRGRRQQLGQRPLQLDLARIVLNLQYFAAAFVVNSKPHTGARPSVRMCLDPELARCVYILPSCWQVQKRPPLKTPTRLKDTRANTCWSCVVLLPSSMRLTCFFKNIYYYHGGLVAHNIDYDMVSHWEMAGFRPFCSPYYA
jgi:hypothetical protein